MISLGPDAYVLDGANPDMQSSVRNVDRLILSLSLVQGQTKVRSCDIPVLNWTYQASALGDVAV